MAADAIAEAMTGAILGDFVTLLDEELTRLWDARYAGGRRRKVGVFRRGGRTRVIARRTDDLGSGSAIYQDRSASCPSSPGESAVPTRAPRSGFGL